MIKISQKIILFVSLFFVLLIALLLLIPFIVFDGVAADQVWLTTSEGVKLKAGIYETESHSENMPGIVVCHGLLASHQTMQSFSLEFAKRGFLVVAIDLSGHGDSDGSISIGETRGDTRFFGDDDYIEVANDASLDLQNEFTLCAWINAGGGMEQIIFNKEGTRELHRDRNYKLSLVGNGALNLRFSSRSNDFDGNVTGNMDLRNAGWKHVVGVYNGSHCFLYVDGEPKASDPTSNAPDGVGADLWIGRGNYAGSLREFNGTIDEVQIRARAREGVLLGAVWLFHGIPLVFVSHLMLMYAIPCSILLLAILVFSRTREKLNLSLLKVKTGAVFGGLGFLVTFVVLNVVFTTGFIDLFPTARELSLMVILFPLFLPLTFFEEVWLRNLQLRLPSESWRKIGIPIALYLLPRVFPLAFASFIFGGFILFASALLVIPAFFTAWLFKKSESILSGAIFNALFSAWIIAVVLPFGGFN